VIESPIDVQHDERRTALSNGWVKHCAPQRFACERRSKTVKLVKQAVGRLTGPPGQMSFRKVRRRAHPREL